MKDSPTISTSTTAKSVEERADELKDCTFPQLGRAALLLTESLLTSRMIAQQVFGAGSFTAKDVLEVNKYLIDMDMALERSNLLRQAQEQLTKQHESQLTGLSSSVPDKRTLS